MNGIGSATESSQYFGNFPMGWERVLGRKRVAVNR